MRMIMDGKRQTSKKFFALIAALIIAPALFFGCAGFGKKKGVQHTSQGISVQKLEDGRIGFIIKEAVSMDETVRKDFDAAVSMLKEKKYEQAIPVFQKIIGLSPHATAPYVNIAIAYQAIDKFDDAEAHLKTALDLYPAHPVVCNEYGLLLRKTGRFAEARAMYEKTIERFPEYFPAHRNLGILCDLYLNDIECALKHYEIYSKANPKDKQVQMWIAGIKLELKKG